MLKATEFEILRNVKASGLINIPLAREPIRVATLMDEAAFMEDNFLVHHGTVFLEDKIHDWNYKDGQFRYYTRVADVADVLIVYAEEEVELPARFDSQTGKRL